MMISFDLGDSMKFNFRAAGLLVVEERILFQRFQNEDYWFLPGGRVEMMEDSLMTIVREVQEEYGWTVTSTKLKIIVENFFRLDGRDFHEMGMYYNIEVVEPLSISDEEFKSVEDNLISKWISLDELDIHRIVPPFLKDKKEMRSILYSDSVKHIINRNSRNI